MKFRPDIDGLRGLAVLLVVAYHAKLRMLSGGYVGVDVFLVISGFVITANLIDLIDHDRFSLVTFLDRRVRRLMPAAVVMVTYTFPALSIARPSGHANRAAAPSASVGRSYVRCALSEEQWHSRRLPSGEARAP